MGGLVKTSVADTSVVSTVPLGTRVLVGRSTHLRTRSTVRKNLKKKLRTRLWRYLEHEKALNCTIPRTT